jgi:hypothetical protein
LTSDIKELEAVRQYLLGQLPTEESSQIEERLLTDAAFYEELLIAEDELVDDYLAGELSDSDRKSCETLFLLTPERQQKIRFALAFKEYVGVAGAAQPDKSIGVEGSSQDADEVPDRSPKKRPFLSLLPFGNPIVSYSFAAAALLIVFGTAWIVVKNWTSQTPHEPGNILVVALSPGLSRDERGTIKEITIPPGTDAVQLKLRISGDVQYQSYRASLQTSDGVEKLRVSDLKTTATGNSVIVQLQAAAGLLTRGDYYVKLSGLNPRGEYDDVGRYSFRVTR